MLVEEADLEAIEQHDTSRSIDISRFVRLDEVDPIYFDRTYFLVPAGGEAQRRPYALLLEAMKDGGVAALGRFVLAGKEKLCLIRPLGDALALETLFVAEDVADHAEIDEAVAGAEVREPELELAKQIIASLAAPFEPAELRSEYRAQLRELLEAKLAGRELELPAEARVGAGRRPDGGAARVGRRRVGQAGRRRKEKGGTAQARAAASSRK